MAHTTDTVPFSIQLGKRIERKMRERALKQEYLDDPDKGEDEEEEVKEARKRLKVLDAEILDLRDTKEWAEVGELEATRPHKRVRCSDE